jgi:1,4-alpha-glucan branching enzyme
MGANLIGNGATFRVWAPGAQRIYVALDGAAGYQPRPDDALVAGPTNDHWSGFFPGVSDGTKYRFYVVGLGRSGLKRDPWARELESETHIPDCDCIVRDTCSYPWHDQDFHPPAFSDLVVYQLHVGVFYARDDLDRDARPYRVAKLLDALDRVEYLADLGVNTVQPLPLVEFHGEWSLGYNGTDLFSPEMDYCVAPPALVPYLRKVNDLLAKKGRPPLDLRELSGQVNQLKAFVDICHLYGLAVIPDVVYNHAGGGLDEQSIDYFDLPANPNAQNSIYFSGGEWAGGKIFAFERAAVRAFLIENAKMFLDEYHADGLRFDEVTVIDSNGGRSFCQGLTETLRYQKPEASLVAEAWGQARSLAVLRPPAGLGFDLGYADELRNNVRNVLAEAAGGATARVDIGRLRQGLERPQNMPFAWQAYNCIENHDLVLDAPNGGHRQPRIPTLADGSDRRSWYARSRARVAAGLLLTAPGVPMLFMGQEFLEDKLWSDNPNRTDRMIWWDGLEGSDRHMADFHRFAKDLIWLRRRHPALRADPINVYFPDNDNDNNNRVLAFHRWLPGPGRDIVVVVSLVEHTFYDQSYALGFPRPGHWHEVFNSDFYDYFPNPWVQGNPVGVTADGPPMHDLPHSAGVTIPANSVQVFAKDLGD